MFFGLLELMIFLPGLALALTPSSISLISGPSPANYGQVVTLTATVSPGTTGKVTFYDGTTILGVGTIASSQAVFSTPLLVLGTRSLHAHYSGDATYAASNSAAVAQTVVMGTSLGLKPAVNYQAGTPSTSEVVGDFNGDGTPDLAMATSLGISVVLGSGDGTFQTRTTYLAGFHYGVFGCGFQRL